MDEQSNIKAGIRHLSALKLSTEMTAKAEKAGLTPLDFLLSIQNNPNIEIHKRIEAAKAAAQYVHPKLSSVDVSGKLGVSHEEALKELE